MVYQGDLGMERGGGGGWLRHVMGSCEEYVKREGVAAVGAGIRGIGKGVKPHFGVVGGVPRKRVWRGHDVSESMEGAWCVRRG